MTAVIREAIINYRYLNNHLSDPRSADYPLVGSPWGVLLIVASYLVFVLKVGPKLMENRKPIKLKRVIICYNAFQILFNAYIFYKALTLKWGRRDVNWFCEPPDYSTTPRALDIVNAIWLYFILKVIDLLDTVFFILRKKERQISFLHIYHHTGMVFATWIAIKYLCSGHMTFLGFVNSFVHMIMYTYYLVTNFYPHSQRNIWWKKYITQLQIAQFLLILLHSVQLFFQPNCPIPLFIPMGMTPQYFFMTFMFCDFYKKTYINKDKKKKEDKQK